MLELMGFGLSNKEIARRLTLGRRTVETHIDHVLRKLDVPNRARAVSEAVRAGIIGTSTNVNSRDTRPNNLPFQLTTLVGRDGEIARLKSVLQANRLVTLSGSGGVGKTRVALRVGFDLLDHYPDGVWFCDLSPIANGDLMAAAVAKVLGAHHNVGRPVGDSIAHALGRKRALLIFDNCEHVLGPAAELTDEILHQCPNVRVLATSRQSLGIIGETVYRLPSLSVPETADDLTGDEAMRYAAIGLFVERAHAADPGFAFSRDEVVAVAEVCRRLDGIPLAIELAASRVPSINVRGLAQSLDDRFRLLAAGNRSALPRHQTLAALIGWSYDLLAEQEQLLIQRLSIFAGGFGLDAAIAVCAGGVVDEHAVWDLLSSLVDKSLAVADVGGEVERYRLLESTRAYASKKLAADDLIQLSRRHAEFYRDEAIAVDTNWGIESTLACLTRMELELDNYRATLRWALMNQHDVVLGAIVAGALWRLWFDGELAGEGHYWISCAQSVLDESAQPLVAGRLWLALSLLSSGQQKLNCARRALALYEAVQDQRGMAWALSYVAFGHFQMGDLDQAARKNARALDLMRKCGDRHGVARSLNSAAMLSQFYPGIGTTRELYVQAHNAFNELRDEISTAHMLTNFAEMEFADGHAQEAVVLVSKALEGFGRGKGPMSLAYCNKAAYLIALGELDQAHEALREGMRLARRSQEALQIASALQLVALLGALGERLHDAARLVGYVDQECRRLGVQRESTEQWAYERLMAVLRQHMSEDEIATLGAQGASWPEDRAIAEAQNV